MLHLFRKARSTNKALRPWSNPPAVSHYLSAILSECGSRFGVETGSPFSTSTSLPTPPPGLPDEKQEKPLPTTNVPAAGKKERNSAYRDFQRSLVRGQPAAAAAAFDAYHLTGGPPSRPMIHSLMDLYSRKNDAESVVKLLHKMIESNQPPPNQHSFGYAISALKKSAASSRQPPASTTITQTTEATTKKITNPRIYAAALQALDLFETMINPRKVNLPPNSTIYNELIDCFGKAGDVDQCFKLFHRAVSIDKIKPTAHTFSILIKACAVAKQPDRANDIVFKLMPEYGLAPGPAAWNGLLNAAAAASGGSVDRAYDVWQKMIDEGVVPDMHTERALAKAFSSHPQLAAELVREARIIAEERRNKIKKDGNSLEKVVSHITKRRVGGKTSLDTLDTPTTVATSAEKQQPALSISRGDSSSSSSGAGAVPTTPSKQPPILLDQLQRKQKNVSAHTLGLAPDLASSFFIKNDKEESQDQHQDEYPYSNQQQEDNIREEGHFKQDTEQYNNNTTTISNLSNLLSLDLHGHSQAAAEMTLLCRLEALVEAWPEIQKTQHAQHENSTTNLSTSRTTRSTTSSDGLIIITGVGKGSRDGLGVLKHAVRAVLIKQGLSAQDVPNNPGRLCVPWEEITRFSEKQWERMQREHIYAAARARYATVGLGLAGLLAAATLIPRLGPWLM